MKGFWGVFELEDSIHVIPCDEEGYIVAPHELDDFCGCLPEVTGQSEDGRPVLAHNSMQ